jgi:hypothetical protein|tara:strand:- start:7278 stop:8846 length:1569 start_codon:yes stop_codon:yes gene_type:complete
MAELSVTEIKKRYRIAEADKEQWRSIYEEAYEYCLPMRNMYDGYYEGNAVGQDKMKRIFDSTAIHSTSRFANRIQSALFPPQRSWCRLTTGTDIPPERMIEVQQILDDYTEKMFNVMNQSGFDLAMGEFLLDLAIGTSVMLIQAGDEMTPIRYTAVPSYQICFEEGANGTVSTVYRKMKRPFDVIIKEFPDATIPDELAVKYRENPNKKVELLEATYEKDGFIYYCVSTMEGDNKLVSRTLKGMPFVISRYMVASNEKMGRGVALMALPDIKTLNKVTELTLKNASISIGGVFTAVDDGVLNPQTISIQAGSVIGVSSNGGARGASLAPLPRSGDANMSQILTNDLRANIKRMMLDDEIAPENMSARTAIEIQHKISSLSENMGASFGRLISETMTPIVRRTLELMDELGIIELPLKIDGLQVKIVPISPLAMASNKDKVNDVLTFLQMTQQMGVVGGSLLKMDAVGDYIADHLGIPSSLRTTPEERQQIMQQTMELAQQQMEQQQGQMPPEQGQNPELPVG